MIQIQPKGRDCQIRLKGKTYLYDAYKEHILYIKNTNSLKVK